MTAHEPAERVQVVEGEKLATPLLAHVTVPVGDAPETLALQVVGMPVVTGEGEHATVVVVADLLTESKKLPELTGLFKSPPYAAVTVTGDDGADGV